MDERTGAEPFPPGTGSSTSRSRRLRGVLRGVLGRTCRPGRLLATSSLALLLPACPAAAPSAGPAPAAAPASCTSMYTVVSGDSWFQIAKKSSVSMDSLLAANSATTSSALFPGMQLCLPQGSTATTAAPGSASTTTVAAGNLPVQLAAFPAQGPCWFIDSWHAPRGGGRLHEGVDIIATAGQYVYAAADGKLSKQTLDKAGSLSGNAWWLTADDGTYFFYAHMSAFAPDLKVGSRVVAGQIIGYVGRTGNASGPHLHFEVHPKGGAAVNPTPIVRAVDGCKNSTPPPQPSGTLPPPPATAAPAGSSGSSNTTAPATTAPATTTPATAPPTTAAPVPVNTAPSAPAAGALWQFVSPKTAYDSSWNGGYLAGNTRQTVKVSGLSGVPSGTAGVLVRLTASDASSGGFVVAYPCDSGIAVASVLSYRQGGSAVGSTMVRVVKGQICVLSSARVKAKVEVLAAQSSAGVGLQPVTATRVLDTRSTGRLTPGTQVQLSNAALGVPAGAQAMTVSVTFVNPDAAGTFSLGFCGQGLWNSPMSADGVSSFSMTMRVSSSGWCLASTVGTDVVIDVTGAWVGSSKVSTVDPLRVFDSRDSGGVTSAGRAVPIAGLGGVPSGAGSALVSLTLVTGAQATSIYAYPCGEAWSTGAVIAAQPGRVTTAVVPVRLGGGQLCLASILPADVIVDVVGAG
ncbi:MAG: peptidoglycan DD-metalloendopeptidase family protein [Acidimicrobiales bacterium]